jgi:2-aminoethylphosphonate-pyruvate transaminase
MTNLKLLNPGPVTLTTRVRQALLRPDLCHREPEFSALQTEIRERLVKVYEGSKDFTATLVTGSGTAAVEMMVGSLVPKGARALVVMNGVYGERIASILEAQGKEVLKAQAEWTSPMNLDATERILAEEPNISHVLAIHHETTTGRHNNIASLGALCRKYNKPLLLDAVSSFGGEEILFDDWNVEACAATANKCLHGVPGISFVLARRQALSERKSGATSVYLDLFRQNAEQEKGSSPFTQSVHVCYALLEALKELEDMGGWEARHRRYQALSKMIFDGLAAQGISPLLPIQGPSSQILTAYRMPPGCHYAGLHDFLKERGFVIYAGQGKFSQEIFRIAVMGDFHTTDAEKLLSDCKAFWATR